MSRDPRIDAYIAKARPFAQPILKRIRAAVHAGCPEVTETIKWSPPAFDYKGPLDGMAAFSEYIEWITGARTDETRARRIATAVQWMSEGKSRNWKYVPGARR